MSYKGKFSIYLHCTGFKSVNIAYALRFELSFVETDTSQNFYYTFCKDNHSYGSTDWPVERRKIEELNSITFKLEMQLIDIYDIDKNAIITPKNVNDIIKPIKIINVPQEKFVWNLTTKTLNTMKKLINNEKMKSKIFILFDLKWRIIIYPDGTDKHNKDM